jgi:hypothetical protein
MCTLLFLNLRTRWRSLVNFTLRPSYPRGKNPVPHWTRSFGFTHPPNIQTSSGPKPAWTFWGRSKKFLPLPWIKPRTHIFSQNNEPKPQQNTPASYLIPIPLVLAKTCDQNYITCDTRKPVLHINASLNVRSSTRPWVTGDTCALQSVM